MPLNVCTDTADAITNAPGGVYGSQADITASIQEALDNIGTTVDYGGVGGVGVVNYQDPYIPYGTYQITSTVNFPNKAGVSLRGLGGVGRTEYYNAVYRAQFSDLRWNGPEDGIMFDIQSRDVRISDLILRGDGPTTTAGVGIRVKKSGAMGTGKMAFDRMYFYSFNDYGIQAARDGDNNCDLISSRDCEFWYCGSAAWAILESQAMGFLVQGNRIATGCPIAVYTEGGGKAVFDNLFVNSLGCTILKAEFTTGGFGNNNGDFYFRNLMLDRIPGTTNPDLMLVDSNARSIDVTFDGGAQSMGGDYFDGQLVAINGNSVCRFKNFRSNFNNMVGTAYNGVSPMFIFEGCPSLQNKNPRLQLSGDYRVQQRGCFKYDTNVEWPDYSSDLNRLRRIASSSR